MKISYLLICFGAALSMDIAHADQASSKVASQGETLVAATTNKFKVQVKIKTHEMQIGKPSDGRPIMIESNCTYSKYPCSIVDRLDISVNGTSLFVPRSAFCDLADLNKAEIKVDEKGLSLRLYGGGASESYVVKIEFNAAEVKRRTLSSTVLPDQPTQETIYHVVTLG